MPEFFIGLDLGQKRDFTALAVVQAVEPTGCYQLRHLERARLSTSYTGVVDRVSEISSRSALCGRSVLVMDGTGVGVAVFDLLRHRGICPVSITITSGTAASFQEGTFRVPKRELVITLAKLFESRRLEIAGSLPDSAALLEELLNFKVRINRRTRRETYEAGKQGVHDDLVLATALACWYAEIGKCFPNAE